MRRFSALAEKKLAMKKKKSPCINVCTFLGPSSYCLGCGRTRKECRDWNTMKSYARAKLQTELKKRMLRIKNA
jgi:predicted Fe-S protein YdhL (DUF1289 family)